MKTVIFYGLEAMILHKARLEKGLTQEQLANKYRINKASILKVVNDTKEVRI